MGEILVSAIADNGELFAMEKMDAHVTGTLHLALSIFVFDQDKLLLQRRALGKYHSGGLWTNTVCTHPYWQETVADAAPRRLQEELGFTVPLGDTGNIDYRAEVGSDLIENERVTLFTGYTDASTLLVKPNPEEVMDVRWVTINEIRDWVSNSPDEFTEWIKIYLDRLENIFPK